MSVKVQAHRVRSPVSLSALARVGEVVLRAERATAVGVSVTLVSAARIAQLNAVHLGVRGPTDVIAFALDGVPGAARSGDVYLAPSVARQQARRLRISVREELMRLVVHGILHVLGHDHPDDTSRLSSPMWRRQEVLLRRAMAART